MNTQKTGGFFLSALSGVAFFNRTSHCVAEQSNQTQKTLKRSYEVVKESDRLCKEGNNTLLNAKIDQLHSDVAIAKSTMSRS